MTDVSSPSAGLATDTDLGDESTSTRDSSAIDDGAGRGLLVWAIVSAPLLVAAVVLAFRPWYPTLDLAMTELRVRDVGGRDTPLIGLPGRIGDFPDQGSHPGPWSFWLVRPFHLLSGDRAWGMELGSAVINSLLVAASLLVARRIAGRRLVSAVAGLFAIAILGYGLSVLTHPWNPYFPLFAWLLVLLATWGVVAGDRWMALVVVTVGSVAAQTHVPYLLMAITMSTVALAALAWRRRWVPFAWSFGAAAVMWFPAAVDQLRREPGNISMLIEHFTGDTDEATIGVVGGTRVLLRHLDLPGAAVRMFGSDDAFLEVSGNTDGWNLGGFVVLAAFVAGCVVAFRRRHRLLMSLDLVLVAALAVGWFSMTRIFGKVWFYLTLWAWGTALLVMLSAVWAGLLVLRDRLGAGGVEPSRRGLVVGAIVVPTLLSLLAVVDLEVPEENLSEGLGAVVDDTEAAVRDGRGDSVGADGRYVVFWQDVNFIGAQGYGLVNELERRGLTVGVHDTWRVPVTPQRVFPQGTYDAEIHLVSGAYIDEWRERPGYVEVASADPRTPDEADEYARLRARAMSRLDEIGRDDVADIVDVNLFGASLDPDLPQDVVDDLSAMLVLTAPVAVFIAPAGSTF